jgi:two-component system, NtrC family, nitrogen regulation sensor histidine kinase GlnL
MEQTELLRALENLSTAVAVLDDAFHVLHLNSAAETLLETSAERAQGSPFRRFVPASTSFFEGLRKALSTGRSYTEREMHIALVSGHEVMVSCAVTPLPEASCKPILLLELIELDRQLRMSREEQLLAQQKAAQAMLRGLAHEVKNPLGGLRGAAQLLALELEDPELREYTRIIIREADRLRKLVDRMLGPNGRPSLAPLCVHEVLEHVRGLIVAEAPTQVRVEQDYDPSIPFLRADRDLLVQALLNIARNALQAVGNEGVICLRTRITRQRTFGHKRHRLAVKLDIIDNGPGIPPQMLEQIFLPMVTSRPQGSGLGLSIAQNLIHQQHGVIECESRPGRTEFSVLLPVEDSVQQGPR